MRLPKNEREEWLGNQLSGIGMVAGFIGYILLFPWFHVFRIHSETAIGLCLVAAVGAGVFLCKRLPRYIGELACVDLLGRISCALRRHDFKPDGVFLHNGCQCVRCRYRPSSQALTKLNRLGKLR